MRRTISSALLGLGLAFATVLPFAAPARAEVSQPILDLTDALQMGEVVMVLRDEGLSNGDDLAADLPGGPQDPQWKLALNRIYDVDAMQAQFSAEMEARLAKDPDAILAATIFFNSELGEKALRLEVDARRALADPAVEEKARAAYQALDKDNPARRALIDRFVVVNDLVESNVMGSLNSNLAFFRGLAAEGGETFGMSEAEMIDQVWSGEPEARKETVDWLFPFLTLAYQPLSDDELQAYIDFSMTPAGRKINAAMFAAFDQMFDGISEELGRTVARQMNGEDI